jgi:ribosomal protein S18 acetylase RimI-like enzyme
VGARGFTRIALQVRTDNTNAKALYERHGFRAKVLERRGTRIDGVYYDTYSMALLV